jgi:NADP-dependent 3-hydroxy acid dehydrogenase YdfG
LRQFFAGRQETSGELTYFRLDSFRGTPMSETESKKKTLPPQTQPRRPGVEFKMWPPPESEGRHYKAAGKLMDKVALISGGDSGIGKAVAVHFAKEGAEVAILYLEERVDAERTRSLVEEAGRRCFLIEGDIGERRFCTDAVKKMVKQFGRLDILVNNAGEQHPTNEFSEITPEQLQHTFRTNLYGMFYLTQAALPHLGPDAAIVNTASITAFRGSATLIDYSATHRRFHALAGNAAGRSGHSRECGRARSDMDATDSGQLRRQKSIGVRSAYADEAAGSAR